MINIKKEFLQKEYVKNKKSILQLSKQTKHVCKTITKYLKKYKIKIRPREYYLQKSNSYKDGRSLKQYYCMDCNKKISYQSGLYTSSLCRSCSKKGRSSWNKNIKMSKKQKLLRSIKMKKRRSYKGKNNPNWKGGIGSLYYPFEFNNELKYKIRKRDNFKCQKCDMTEEENIVIYGRVLEIHHIDYNKENCEEDNLITTCKQCNIRANGNRDYWYAYFQHIIRRKQWKELRINK